MKSVRIRSYSGPHFPAFGVNTGKYSVSLRIHSECEKTRNRITPNTTIFTQFNTVISRYIIENCENCQNYNLQMLKRSHANKKDTLSKESVQIGDIFIFFLRIWTKWNDMQESSFNFQIQKVCDKYMFCKKYSVNSQVKKKISF